MSQHYPCKFFVEMGLPGWEFHHGAKVDYQVLKLVPWVNAMMTDSEKIDYFI